ncbi:precorrin-3B C(17)-methyltransferase [Anaerosalibacter bizertensis]|uniref:precorrin-3B C(17)-methyltransferase n=1 Tax=Anaerosalibacter bizertensis TaxID=932217 RepID=UPI00176B3315|nr:precorrin-3B C(17)-methyltransferase [Anaerosalibacter bizertensis]MBU5293477.1 precorrin-3B C(17)-methyltransferase [Anaerosalibacter bizertensis]HHV26572.1 precorrin-3B C(17)-methyltransferase [Tissierellia bacterium]
MAKLYVVGIGPGGREDMTFRAVNAVKNSQVIVGYTPYIEYLEELVEGKEIISTGMKGELERCKAAIESVKNGKDTAIVSTGDAGLYGMAGPILEMATDIDVEIVPGVTAAFSAAGELGSPIMHDFCSISLSDLLTPWELIEKRIEKASEADFVITIYNPRSRGRKKHIEKAVEIMLKHKLPSTPVGIVKNSGRSGQKQFITTLDDIDYERIDMLSVLIVGNSKTYVENGHMITPRGYHL